MTAFDFIARFILFVIPGFISYALFCYLTSQHQTIQITGIAYVFVGSIISFMSGKLLLMLINLCVKDKLLLVDITQILSGQQQVIATPDMADTQLVCLIRKRIIEKRCTSFSTMAESTSMLRQITLPEAVCLNT